jgi:hypothetical protein
MAAAASMRTWQPEWPPCKPQRCRRRSFPSRRAGDDGPECLGLSTAQALTPSSDPSSATAGERYAPVGGVGEQGVGADKARGVKGRPPEAVQGRSPPAPKPAGTLLDLGAAERRAWDHAARGLTTSRRPLRSTLTIDGLLLKAALGLGARIPRVLGQPVPGILGAIKNPQIEAPVAGDGLDERVSRAGDLPIDDRDLLDP